MVMLISGLNVQACSCAEIESTEKALETRDAVFSGTVLKIEEPQQRRWIQSSAALMTVTIKVDTVWKGDIGEIATVKTAISGASCGYPFVENKTYLVYASHDGEDWRTILCDRTAPLAEAQEDLTQLGPGKPPERPYTSLQTNPDLLHHSDHHFSSAVVHSEERDLGKSPYGLLVAGGLIILTLVTVYIQRRKRVRA